MTSNFWKYVDRKGPIHPIHGRCWNWTGCNSPKGYGQIAVKGKLWRAHRHSYVIHVSPIPKGACVLHKCDNPNCVNPSHLFLGNNLVNAQDRNQKGRQAKREGHGSAKLTESQVTEIRRVFAAVKSPRRPKRGTATALAKKFGVTRATIMQVVQNRTWKV